ncbi:MAG: Ig-like domain-containing protein, partial [Anaerolineae bacterium]
MSLPRLLKILFLVLIFALSTACSRPEAEATATPLPPTVTAVPPTSPPTPTISPTPTRSLEILPIGSDMALPPKVIGQNPALGEEAALDGVFEVFFNQPMNEAETSAALQVVDENGAPVAGDISWPQPRIMRFKPAQRLQLVAVYRAWVAGPAVPATGTPLLEGLSLDFYTIGNLFVSQISPGRNVEDVAIDSAITVIFNRPVVPLLIAEEQANLPHPLEITPAPAGSGEWISTSVYVFRPDEPLIGRETYTVRVKAGLINEASVTGAKMVVDYESSFTVTAPTFNVLELVDLSYNPRTQYQDLPLDQTFRLLFNQPMDKGSTETAVFLNPLDNNSGQVPLQFAWNEAATSLTITPTQLLQLDTNYVLRVGDEARSAHGGRLRDPFSWQATTVKAPAILFTEPGNGSSAARFDSTFRIQFASPMDVESLRGKVLIMPEPLGDPDGLYSYWDWSLRFYGFEPSTTYTVQILPGMADPYGNRIETEQTITFTTAPYGPTADLNLPYDLALYRYGGSDAIWVTHRNVQQLDVDLYQLSLPEFGGLMQGDIYGVRFVPPDAQRLRQQSVTVDTLLNTLTHKRFSLTNGTESLPPGFYFITLDTPNIQQTAPHLRASPLVMSTANVTLK